MPYSLGAVLAQRAAPASPRGGDDARRAAGEDSALVSELGAALAEAIVARTALLGFREWRGSPPVPLYRYLRGRRIEPGLLPLRILEYRGSWVWRGRRPLATGASGRVEHVFIGTREQVLASRRLVRERLEDLLTEAGLSWLVSVGRPCLESHRLWDLEDATTPEDVPVQDLESLLTAWRHAGRPEPADFEEVGDCSCEGAHLLQTLGITSADCEAPWSGSCGIDVRRLAAAVLFQHGFEAADWPDWLRLRYRSLAAAE